MLTDELLARIHDRAPGYDRDNVFFTEDLEELKAVGYLTMLVPAELGGGGLGLEQATAGERVDPDQLMAQVRRLRAGVKRVRPQDLRAWVTQGRP